MSAVIAGFPSNPQNFAACRDGLRHAAQRYGSTQAQLDKALATAFHMMRVQGYSSAKALAEAGRLLRNGQIVVAQPTPPPAA